MASALLPSVRQVALRTLNCRASAFLRFSPLTRQFSEPGTSTQPIPDRDNLSDLLRAQLRRTRAKNDPAYYRTWREEILRKLDAIGVLDLPKPLEEIDEEGQEAVFRRMTKELHQIDLNRDLPSPEERAKWPSPRVIQACERLCEQLNIPLPFDKDTARAGEVCDALIRLTKRRYHEDPEPKPFYVAEEHRSLSPTFGMKQAAVRMEIEYSRNTSRGELADKISEKRKEKWRERRAARAGAEQTEGGESPTAARSGERENA